MSDKAAVFRQLLLQLPTANEQKFLELAKALQENLDDQNSSILNTNQSVLKNDKIISDFDIKQAGLHLWNGAVRLKQGNPTEQTNCESIENNIILY